MDLYTVNMLMISQLYVYTGLIQLLHVHIYVHGVFVWVISHLGISLYKL